MTVYLQVVIGTIFWKVFPCFVLSYINQAVKLLFFFLPVGIRYICRHNPITFSYSLVSQLFLIHLKFVVFVLLVVTTLVMVPTKNQLGSCCYLLKINSVFVVYLLKINLAFIALKQKLTWFLCLVKIDLVL